jgi:hypothetical protein
MEIINSEEVLFMYNETVEIWFNDKAEQHIVFEHVLHRISAEERLLVILRKPGKYTDIYPLSTIDWFRWKEEKL